MSAGRARAEAIAQVILVRRDGAIILQRRDDKPGISNPGRVSAFGGHLEPNEGPLAAVREINEETNLDLRSEDMTYFRKYQKTPMHHGESREVYYFVARGIDDSQLQVFEGQGFVAIKNLLELAAANPTVLISQALKDYFEHENYRH